MILQHISASYKRFSMKFFETLCVMAVQGHLRSLILAPIDSAYVASCYESVAALVLSCIISEIR